MPSHAYKFMARLQASQGCPNPALLQVAWGAGHAYGTNAKESAATLARQWAFIDRVLQREPSEVH